MAAVSSQSTASMASQQNFIAGVSVVALGWIFRRKQTPLQGDSRKDSHQAALDPRDRRRSRGVKWIAPGERVDIAGHTISAGMLYVGRARSSDRQWRSTIDPSLEVARHNADIHGELMSYWPSYATLAPRSRLAYLQWLAGGRSDPSVGVGLAFLFFYGLEKRLFADKAHGEIVMLIAEVERLRELFAHNRSFRRYSGHFLDAARAIQALAANSGTVDEPPSQSQDVDWELPLTLRLALGRRLAAGEALTADWMLTWYLAHPETRLRTPASRAFPLFCDLFRLRFKAAYPDGLLISPPKPKLNYEYRAASGDFTSTISADSPDIINLRQPIRVATTLAESCADELAGYSRLIGKNPDVAHGLEAISLLPKDLREHSMREAGADLTRWLESTVGDTIGVAKGSELLTRLELELDNAVRIPKKLVRTMSSILEALGYGMEPDPRYGGPSPKSEEPVVLFKTPKNGGGASGHAYTSAMATLAIAAGVAHADGVIVDQEIGQLVNSVQDNLHLTASERRRLSALATWLLLVPPPFAQLKKHLSGISEDSRHRLARFALATAAADDRIDASEVKLLERFYKLLDFEPNALYSDLHALEGDDAAIQDEPITVRPATADARKHRIPTEPGAERAGPIMLNHERIERVRRETEVVATVLSDIFAEPADSEPDLAPEVGADKPAAFDGLDRRHTAFVDELLRLESWPRTDFEALCRSLQLLPDGAIETVNEWSFERFDAALIDDGDPLVIQYDVLPDEAREAAA
ncbi:MAG: TerB N-terminal domain-containing protein [Alphaproteobacteria bacterium]